MSTESAAVRDEMNANEQIGSDLSRFDNRKAVRDLRADEAASAASEKKPKPRAKFHTPKVIVLLCLVAALSSGLLIMRELDLTVINDEISDLEDELQELKNENVHLNTEYESRYDLEEVEAYAVSELGMIKMERSQVEYVEIASPDTIRAVSPEENEKSSYLVANLVKSFNAVLDFLRSGEE